MSTIIEVSYSTINSGNVAHPERTDPCRLICTVRTTTEARYRYVQISPAVSHLVIVISKVFQLQFLVPAIASILLRYLADLFIHFILQ